MNILYFLTPKSEVAYVYDDSTLRQVLEKMEFHRYSSIPVISKQGKYIGTLTEGDLLWYIKNKSMLNLKEAEEHVINEVDRNRDYLPVNVSTKVEDVIAKSLTQNFIPVIDDLENFIGIVKRKDIIKYYYEKRGNLKKI